MNFSLVSANSTTYFSFPLAPFSLFTFFSISIITSERERESKMFKLKKHFWKSLTLISLCRTFNTFYPRNTKRRWRRTDCVCVYVWNTFPMFCYAHAAAAVVEITNKKKTFWSLVFAFFLLCSVAFQPPPPHHLIPRCNV